MNTANDPETGACIYLLSNLLQRLETEKEGFLQEMINGVKADQEATPREVLSESPAGDIFTNALSILTRCQQGQQRPIDTV